ncbi:hypothetical protein [Pseudomonas sp. UV AK001]|uniref:hypothetical protein n=1 Tax=Pseudomonas sp. UV AK001 TaxID=3384791 RepID=UPI0038D360D6
MIKLILVYFISSFILVNASEKLVVENNGCVLEAPGFARFSFMKVDRGASYVKYKYKDSRVESIKISCRAGSLSDSISSDFVQEKDGLKLGIGASPFSKANLYSGKNLSGVEGVYFLGAVCFTTTFEAGRDHVFFIDVCGEEGDIKEVRHKVLYLLKQAKTYYADEVGK